MKYPHKLFRAAAGAVCVCCVLSLAVGQQMGTIAGTVFDREAGNPIPLVNVFVRGTLWGTSTDSVGHFEISLPADTKHILVFSHVAYVKKWYDVEAVNGEQMVVDVELEPRVLPLNDFTVAGTAKTEELQAASIIREEEIERMGPVNFEDLLLRRLPQFRWTSAVAAAQRRTDFVLYVDGMAWDPRFLNQIDPYTVRKVVVFRSIWASPFYRTGSSRYVVDVRTR